MNFKLSVILLHLFTTTTLPTSHNATSSLDAFASAINDSTYRSQLHRLPSITTTATISAETCTAPHCNHLLQNSSENPGRAQHHDDHHNELIQSAKAATNSNGTAEVMARLFSQQYMQSDRLASSSIIYGLLSVAAQKGERGQCYSELNQIYEGIQRKEIWAMKVLDSSGNPESGFVLGHSFWLGSIKGCEAVQNPHTLTLSNRFERVMHANLQKARAPFDIGYRVVYAAHTSPWQIQVEFLLDAASILHIGLCLPTSCSNRQIADLSQEYFDSEVLDAQNVLEQHPNVLDVKDLNVKTDFFQKGSVQIIAIFILFTILMMVIAYVNEENAELTAAANGTVHNTMNGVVAGAAAQLPQSNGTTTDAKTMVNPPDVILGCKKVSSIAAEKSFSEKFVKCFSVRDNFRNVISTDKPASAIPVIDGFKSIGCFLILIFHMNWYIHYTVHNPAMMFAYGETPLWLWVSTTPIIVDVFFTISGLLLAYNFLRNKTKIQEIQENTFWENVKLYGKQFVHRYIRLTPLYLIVVGLTEVATTYLVETSPFWVHDRYDVTCKKYWWRNVLYIQNLFSVHDLCLSWTWSMACEMQFFVLFTALLFLYAKYPNAAKALYCSLFGIFAALVLLVATFDKFTPAYDVMHDLGYDLYVSPFTRVLPYLVGVGAGYMLFTSNGEMPFQEKTVKIFWTLATTIAVLSHFSVINRDISYVYAAPLITAVRILYSASIAWMILASAMGHGGFFAKILNYSVFVHVNKLSYAIYLLNPLVIAVIYGSKDHSTHVEPLTMTIMSVGVSVVCYLLSIVFSIMFEVPYTKVSGLLWKRSRPSAIPLSKTTSDSIPLEKIKKSS